MNGCNFAYREILTFSMIPLGLALAWDLSQANAGLGKESGPDKKPPAPEIKITSPTDKITLNPGTILQAKGTSNLPNTPILLLVTNKYDGPDGSSGEYTHKVEFKTDADGNWEDPGEVIVKGPGTWTVEIEVIAQKKVKAKRNGDVSNP